MEKYNIDYQDAKAMWQFQMDTLKIADDFANARMEFGNALKSMKIALAKAYRDNLIERRIAEDKAYLILANENEEHRTNLSNMIHFESQYKGLEKVLEARQGAISFNQSLIKNQLKQT